MQTGRVPEYMINKEMRFTLTITSNQEASNRFPYTVSLPLILNEDTTSNKDSINPISTSILQQNYPNPFNAQTTIAFTLLNAGNIQINVYNTRGQLVRKLIDGFVENGNHTIVWDGKDDNNRELASGIYFYQMISDDNISTRRAILLK
jgi:hypothetical protein